MKQRSARQLNRRELMQGGGLAAVAVFSPLGCGGGRVQVARPLGELPDGASSFLTTAELRTLNAVVDRFIPEDTDPGAAVAGCADAINALLSAFTTDPPRIFAGAPFSDRGGWPVNHFEDFLPLDPYEAFAWQLKIEGSKGLPEREFNGPVTGWQSIYRAGLARLNERASAFGASDFAALPPPARDLLLRDSEDQAIAALVDVAFLQTLDAMYGAPEYGGNRELAGWGFTGYDGDVQPRGYTDAQVTQPDNPGLFGTTPGGLNQGHLLPLPSPEELLQMHKVLRATLAMHSGELALGVMLNSEGQLVRLRRQMQQWQGDN